MDVKEYNQDYDRDPSNLLAKLDLAHPERIVVEDKKIHQLMRQYMSLLGAIYYYPLLPVCIFHFEK